MTLNTDIEILSAVKNGVFDNGFRDKYPPTGVINKETFEKLRAEGFISVDIDVSARDAWGYNKVELTINGEKLLEHLLTVN